ncbi:hypothetical protein Sipo8835_19870 [Streptomyces ipomoeae]|uniref:Uncharacterized protein n=1 Tax=Streptomyces ipomoeae TaxID=103232 RepID=A0AAE8W2Y4_9ACTN|nr:hypothetical protein [Streptomyces ipomoeae]TQE32616.1 hypothetical protein Sipo8835_19870 [Streptomyces ipomoeae]
MNGDSMAERKLRRLQVNRTDQLAHIREELLRLGDHESLRQLDASMAEWRKSEGAAPYDPVTALMRHVTGEMKTALRDLGFPQERLDTVVVCSFPQDDVSAQMTPFADGSGLVEVSDSILTLAGEYGQFSGIGLARIGSRGALRGILEAFRAARGGAMGGDPAVLTALLRYYNVNQRVFGKSAKLGHRTSPQVMEVGSLVTLQAARFVIGHELAHHVLEHRTPLSAFSPGEHVPACTGDQRLELDADLLAYRATVRASERELAGTPAEPAIQFSSLLGPLVAMLAVHVTEQALFVRSGTTHPPARTRAQLLLDRIDERERNVATLFLSTLLTATERSAVFDGSAPVFDWEWAVRSPDLLSSQPQEYLRTITVLDRLQSQSRDSLVEVMERMAEDAGSWVAEGARLAAAGNCVASLGCWGVDEATAAVLADPRRALLFHTLVDEIRTGLAKRGTPDTALLRVSVAAGCLAGSGLKAAAGQ